jgi:hypothetical protein
LMFSRASHGEVSFARTGWRSAAWLSVPSRIQLPRPRRRAYSCGSLPRIRFPRCRGIARRSCGPSINCLITPSSSRPRVGR